MCQFCVNFLLHRIVVQTNDVYIYNAFLSMRIVPTFRCLQCTQSASYRLSYSWIFVTLIFHYYYWSYYTICPLSNVNRMSVKIIRSYSILLRWLNESTAANKKPHCSSDKTSRKKRKKKKRIKYCNIYLSLTLFHIQMYMYNVHVWRWLNSCNKISIRTNIHWVLTYA